MLDAIYVDSKEEKAIVAIRPKPAFRATFQIVTSREESGVVLIKEEPLDTNPEAQEGPLCLWWRPGRLDHSPSIFPEGLYPVITTRSAPRPSILLSTALGPRMAMMELVGKCSLLLLRGAMIDVERLIEKYYTEIRHVEMERHWFLGSYAIIVAGILAFLAQNGLPRIYVSAFALLSGLSGFGGLLAWRAAIIIVGLFSEIDIIIENWRQDPQVQQLG